MASLLAELLTALHGSDRSFATLHSQYRLWERRDIAQKAFVSVVGSERVHVGPTSGEGTTVDAGSEVMIWQAPPAPPQVAAVAVADPSLPPETHCDELAPEAVVARDAATVGGTPGSETSRDSFRGLWRPWRLPSALWFRTLEEGEWRARRMIRAQALPRPDVDRSIRMSDARDLSGLGVGANRYELLIDAELGIIVDACAYFENTVFHVVRLRRLEVQTDT